MDDTEHAQDDFDIEITDIPEQDTDGDDSIGRTSSQSRSLLSSRFPLHQRVLQSAVGVSLVVLALLLILGSNASVPNAVSLSLFGPTPTPTATLSPGFDLFYIQSALPWGQVSLDGHVISPLPRAGLDPPLRLAPGRHYLAWLAEPFQLSPCTVSVPPATTDSCNYNRIVETPSGIDAWLIIFSPSLATLPDGQRTAVIEAAQAALDTLQSTETVRSGEQYVYNQSAGTTVRTTVQALRAILRFQLDTSTPSEDECAVDQIILAVCQMRGFDCRLFCTLNFRPREQGQPWDVSAVIYSIWKYTTADGQVVAQNQLDSFLSGQGVEHNVELHIIWDSAGWHVSIPNTWNHRDEHITSPVGLAAIPGENLPCASAEDDIGLDGYYGLTGGSINEPIDWTFVSGATPAAGCLAIGTPQKDSTGPSPSPDLPVAYCLHRFGVLLAVNEAAHRYWPNMPMADAYEQAIAQKLADSIKA